VPVERRRGRLKEYASRVRPLLALVTIETLGALLACSSTSASTTTGSPDTCGFVKDANNCWHELFAQIEACLGDIEGEKGALAADGKTCSYPSGRLVTFAIPLDPATKYVDKDFTATVGGKACLHYLEVKSTNTFSITGPNGLVVRENGDLSSGSGTLVCPDGSSFRIDETAVLKSCLSEAVAGGLPGSTTSFDGKQSSLTLLGSSSPAFNCSR
jgi:hypothetical protein